MTIKISKRTATSNGDYYECDVFTNAKSYSLEDHALIVFLKTDDETKIEKQIIRFSSQVDYKIRIIEEV